MLLFKATSLITISNDIGNTQCNRCKCKFLGKIMAYKNNFIDLNALF